MNKHVTEDQLALETSDQNVINASVFAGLGLGFLAKHDAEQRRGLVEIISSRDRWSTDLWIVTHVDLHRTRKVREFVKFLKNIKQVPHPVS